MRLKTDLWVSAERKRIQAAGLYCLLLKKGDGDRGSVYEKILLSDGQARLFERTLDFDGNDAWRMLGSGDAEAEADIDVRLMRRLENDPDAWALEIEDPKNIFELDAPLLEW